MNLKHMLERVDLVDLHGCSRHRGDRPLGAFPVHVHAGQFSSCSRQLMWQRLEQTTSHRQLTSDERRQAASSQREVIRGL